MPETGFYNLSKEEREKLVVSINRDITGDISEGTTDKIFRYFSDDDTYIRKAGYLAVGRICRSDNKIKSATVRILHNLFNSDNVKVRQTVINAAGEIGIYDFETVEDFFNKGLLDIHHSVRNAVTGSVKKMSEKNPRSVLNWARQYLHHRDKEVRKQICHGIELRGRTHPQDVLPLLEELQNDESTAVRKMLIHVLGQISYKKGCLQKVIKTLNHWDNQLLVMLALDEIVEVHERYQRFAVLSQQEVIEFINSNYAKSVTDIGSKYRYKGAKW